MDVITEIQKEIDRVYNDCQHLKSINNKREPCLTNERHCRHYCSVHNITYCCGGDWEIKGRHIRDLTGRE